MRADLSHLFRAAAFGATPEQLHAPSWAAAVETLLPWPDDQPVTPSPFVTLLPPGPTLGFLEIVGVVQWWLDEMIATPWPLREKMVLFWHGHFTTSADPVFSSKLLLEQNQLLRSLAIGRFEDLLVAIARNPAMLVYLDGKDNHQAHPNENFARELLELFTVGMGEYTEADVKAAARALTGWKLEPPDGHAAFDPATHDDGDKQFMTLHGRLDSVDVLRYLAAHPATARRLCSRLFRFLTGWPIPGDELERLTAVYHGTRGHVGAVLRQMLLGDAFRTSRGGWRSPIECVVHAGRALGGHAFKSLGNLNDMGQIPFVPPSVKGWDDGPAWINTATVLERVKWAARLAESPPPDLVELVDQGDVRHAVLELLCRLGMTEAAPTTVDILCEVAQATRSPPQRARQLLMVALSSPDFQIK